ncbi:MAG: tripartite tricarboxylate transporter substrate binding protein [Deltaproteobacteria bacterium]|nr:tripartite tricarboxylate transporter substrate binding protein [Deltaproteobacteria bacterium]
MKKALVILSAIFFALGCAATALAQEAYPSKPVKVVIPLGPGSGNDVVTRILSGSLEKELKTQIAVEYKAGGGGGVVGADFVAKSKPDGYTLGTLNNSVFTFSPVFTSVPYDPFKDFTPIARLGAGSTVLVVNAPAPWKTLEEFLEHARRNPGKVTCGTTGATAVGGISLELLNVAAGVKLVIVPYKEGSGPNIAALLGGHIDCAMQLWPILINQVRGGKLRPLASASPLKEVPQVPTFAQKGLPAVNLEVWFGFYGPANLPKNAMAKLVPAFEKALREPENVAKLEKIGWRVAYEGPQEMAERIKKEFSAVQDIAKKAGIKPE